MDLTKGSPEDIAIRLNYPEQIKREALESGLIKKVPNLQKIKELLPFDYHFFLIAGSYADGSYTSKSDLDVVVVTGESLRGASAQPEHPAER